MVRNLEKSYFQVNKTNFSIAAFNMNDENI